MGTLGTGGTQRRILAVAALTGLALVGLAGRLLAVQVLGHERYRASWSRQVRARIEEPAERGRIRFRDGETAALSRQRAPSVYVDPTEVADPDAAAPPLAEALGLPASEVREKLARPGRFAWLARRVSPAERAAVGALGIRGVGLRNEAERIYPHGPCGSLAAHLIGFVGVDHVGLEGIEAAFQGALAGRPGFRVLARDALGRMAVEPEAPREPAVPGCDVVLALEAAAQRVAEEELAAAVARWRAAWGCALVLDVATGEVRAWAVLPTYDPGDAARTPPDSRRNRALTDPVEPGSVFKAFTVGTALAEGAVAPETKLDCGGGEWAYRGRKVHDFHRYGTLTVEEILVKSSNIGAARATLALGGSAGDPGSREARAWARLEPALRAFGFGAPTGVGLPGEEAGRIGGDPREGWKWSYHTLLSVSFGHEVLVTPLQLAAAMNAIANDGLWVPPRVVRRIEGRDGAN
ncbi:MAG: penicillin-binding protein 2, partial [Planctomycetales bacterium]|nr:penicillin-binding protein 2 [Planctomycetales bacterium]